MSGLNHSMHQGPQAQEYSVTRVPWLQPSRTLNERTAYTRTSTSGASVSERRSYTTHPSSAPVPVEPLPPKPQTLPKPSTQTSSQNELLQTVSSQSEPYNQNLSGEESNTQPRRSPYLDSAQGRIQQEETYQPHTHQPYTVDSICYFCRQPWLLVDWISWNGSPLESQLPVIGMDPSWYFAYFKTEVDHILHRVTCLDDLCVGGLGYYKYKFVILSLDGTWYQNGQAQFNPHFAPTLARPELRSGEPALQHARTSDWPWNAAMPRTNVGNLQEHPLALDLLQDRVQIPSSGTTPEPPRPSVQSPQGHRAESIRAQNTGPVRQAPDQQRRLGRGGGERMGHIPEPGPGMRNLDYPLFRINRQAGACAKCRKAHRKCTHNLESASSS